MLLYSFRDSRLLSIHANTTSMSSSTDSSTLLGLNPLYFIIVVAVAGTCLLAIIRLILLYMNYRARKAAINSRNVNIHLSANNSIDQDYPLVNVDLWGENKPNHVSQNTKTKQNWLKSFFSLTFRQSSTSNRTESFVSAPRVSDWRTNPLNESPRGSFSALLGPPGSSPRGSPRPARNKVPEKTETDSIVPQLAARNFLSPHSTSNMSPLMLLRMAEKAQEEAEKLEVMDEEGGNSPTNATTDLSIAEFSSVGSSDNISTESTSEKSSLNIVIPEPLALPPGTSPANSPFRSHVSSSSAPSSSTAEETTVQKRKSSPVPRPVSPSEISSSIVIPQLPTVSESKTEDDNDEAESVRSSDSVENIVEDNPPSPLSPIERAASILGRQVPSKVGRPTNISSESIATQIDNKYQSLLATQLNPTLPKSHDNLALAATGYTIQWSQLYITELSTTSAVIGSFRHGFVVKAVWRPRNYESHPDYIKALNGIPVAVKLVSKALMSMAGATDDFEQICREMRAEAAHIVEVERRMDSGGRNIIKVHGVATGNLSSTFVNMFRLPSSASDGLGVVMRCEEGGTLKEYLYDVACRLQIPMIEKLRILSELARGLADLHAAGLTHGALSPDRVFFTDVTFQQLRLSSFGRLSLPGDNPRIPAVYRPPECLMNPLESHRLDEVEKIQTRAGDMYTFAIICWEILAQCKPFQRIKDERIITTGVLRGQRPDLASLPDNTPEEVVELLCCCWDEYKGFRKSAAESLSVLLTVLAMRLQQRPDIVLMTPPDSPHVPFISQIYRLLTLQGFQVLLDRFFIDDDKPDAVVLSGRRSQALILFADESLMEERAALQDFSSLVSVMRISPVVVLLQENFENWGQPPLTSLIDAGEVSSFDLSEISNKQWGPAMPSEVQTEETDETSYVDIIAALKIKLNAITEKLKNAGILASANFS